MHGYEDTRVPPRLFHSHRFMPKKLSKYVILCTDYSLHECGVVQEIYYASISSTGTLWFRVLHNMHSVHQERHLMAFLATNSYVHLN